jgi:hypothetical protein
MVAADGMPAGRCGGMTRLLLAVAVAVAVVVACVGGAAQSGCSAAGTSNAARTSTAAGTGNTAASANGDSQFARAFADRAGSLELEGQGTVSSLLADDTEGARHQRFIVRLDSGQTLLVTHNVDIAPRVPELRVGDTVSFKGEYEWNAQGGVMHWTHHDPSGRHVAGWIRHNGRTYQ